MREATPDALAASAFRGYTIIVSWQDGWSCRWHGESIPDVTQLEAMRPGVWSVTYAAASSPLSEQGPDIMSRPIARLVQP